MPSETMDFKRLSSSLYSFEDVFSPAKSHVGFWKSDKLSNCYDSDQGTEPNMNAQTASKFSESSKVDVIGTRHESSLFSSSLSELFSSKLRLSVDNGLHGHSVDTVASKYEEEMPFDSLEELEAQTIGNLLPNDDDDSLGALTDGDGHIIQDIAGDDLDELDLFTSVGGMDLGDDGRSSSGKKNSKFIDGTCNCPEESLHALNRNDTSWSRLKVEPSQCGDSKKRMFQHVHPEQKEYLYLHQNSPPLKSPTSFRGLHGPIKPGSMDGERIPGASEPAMHAPSLETSFRHRVSSSVPNILDNRCGITESSSLRDLNFGIEAASNFNPHSLPECHGHIANVVLDNPPELAAKLNLRTQERVDDMQFCQVNLNGHAMEFNERGLPLPGHPYNWSNSYQNLGTKWPNLPSYFDGVCAGTAPALPRLHGLSRSPSHMMSTVIPVNNQRVASAPAINCNICNRQHFYAGESPVSSVFHPGSVGRFSSNAAHCVDLTSHDVFLHFGLEFHNPMGMTFPGRNHAIPMINSFGNHKGRARNRRNEGGLNLVDSKQYELDIDRIKKGEDNRTTLMIKNIPNKYTSKMLLGVIDERHKGTYDFVYLPIDFKNKCNVGYAFINMIDPSLIIPFYQVFNGRKWEKFHSEKVATLAYARIQGKAALISHFQNSSLMNVDKRCRPILFNTDGPNAGDEVPFPVSDNVGNKSGRVRNNTFGG